MRINLLDGPSCGKSTTATWLFSELKIQGYSIEYVSEYVKTWAYLKRPVQKFDQIYIFGQQQQAEYKYLSRGVKNIVTDSPVILSALYANFYYNDFQWESLLGGYIQGLAELYEQEYPCFNIILDRGDNPYIQEGRYEDEAAAKNVDKYIDQTMFSLYPDNTMKINYKDRELILHEVIKHLEK